VLAGGAMKSIAIRVSMVAVAISLIFTWSAHRAQSVVAAQQHTPLALTRIYTGADGQSHAEQVNVNFPAVAAASPTNGQSEPVKVTSAYIARVAPGFVEGRHNADTRRYVVPVSGRAEVEVGGGQKFSVDPGRIYIAEDLTGEGHTFRVVGGDDWVALFVEFAP
jgi:broad specificity polyphosphatase/5'/3'-nucleotidase SurE